MDMLAGLLIAMVIYLGVIVLMGGVMLRASIALSNRFLGETPGEIIVEGVAHSGQAPSDPNNPFSAPQVQEVAVAGGIPVPSFGRACVIAAAQAISGFALSFAMGLMIGFGFTLGGGQGATELAQVVSFAMVIPLYAFIVSTMLPTTFRRGLLILLSQGLICLLIGFIFVVIFLAMGFGSW